MHASSINETMRADLVGRLIEEYGTAKNAVTAMWALARENGWYREGEYAERRLLHQPPGIVVTNEAALDLIVAWHGISVGHLTNDGFEWRWRPRDYGGPPIVRQTTPGKLPPFILSLMPEGWLKTILNDKDERAVLRSGKRYMSNIEMVGRESELAALPVDVLRTPLQAFSREGVFTGRYVGPGRGDIEDTFERNLARIFESADAPRLSGIQIKAPMYLDPAGSLWPSVGRPFTHILKPAGTGGFDALPVVEWLALSLGRAAGFTVPDTALAAMPDGMPPALIVERFRHPNWSG